MTILLALLPLGLFFLAIALGLFVWAVRSDQFENLDSEGERILFEDDPVPGTHREQRPRASESQS